MEPGPTTTTTTTASSIVSSAPLSLKSASEFFNKGLLKLDSLSEVLTSAATGESSQRNNVHEWSRGELLELTAQLSSKLRRAEVGMRAMQERNAAKTELLRRCLMGTATVACDGREEILELINEIADNDNPDVDRDSSKYKETLAGTLTIMRRHDSDSEVRLVESVALLEQKLNEEQQRRELCELEKAALQARLETQNEAWKAEREKSAEIVRAEEQSYRDKLKNETDTINEKIRVANQVCREALAMQDAQWQARLQALEDRTKQELDAAEAAKVALERVRNARALEQGAEMEQLRARIVQLEAGLHPEEALVQLARSQASRDAIVHSLKKQVTELTDRVTKTDKELYDARRLLNALQSKHPVDDPTTVRHGNDVEIRLDYLRHCVVRYIVEPPLVKKSLVVVLATMLNFSAEERGICDSVVSKLVEDEAGWFAATAAAAAAATTGALVS